MLTCLIYDRKAACPVECDVVAAQPESKFAAAYQAGISKLNYWDPVYEDSLNLIAKLPGIAALIYRSTYKGGDLIPHDPNLDWAANLSHQMGAAFPSLCAELTRNVHHVPACMFY